MSWWTVGGLYSSPTCQAMWFYLYCTKNSTFLHYQCKKISLWSFFIVGRTENSTLRSIPRGLGFSDLTERPDLGLCLIWKIHIFRYKPYSENVLTADLPKSPCLYISDLICPDQKVRSGHVPNMLKNPDLIRQILTTPLQRSNFRSDLPGSDILRKGDLEVKTYSRVVAQMTF